MSFVRKLYARVIDDSRLDVKEALHDTQQIIQFIHISSVQCVVFVFLIHNFYL